MAVTQLASHVTRSQVNHDTAFTQVQHRRDPDEGKHPFSYLLGWEFTSADLSKGATGGGYAYNTGASVSMPGLPTNCRIMDGYLNVKTPFRKSGSTGQGMLHAITVDGYPLILDTTDALTGARFNNLRRGMRSFLDAATGTNLLGQTLESGATAHTVIGVGSVYSWGVPAFYTGGQITKAFFELEGGCTYSTGAAEIMFEVISYAEN